MLMIRIICFFCDKALTKPGALLFSPPDDREFCRKFHVCVDCFSKPIIRAKRKKRESR